MTDKDELTRAFMRWHNLDTSAPTAIDEAVKQARREALEEALRVCEEYVNCDDAWQEIRCRIEGIQ